MEEIKLNYHVLAVDKTYNELEELEIGVNKVMQLGVNIRGFVEWMERCLTWHNFSIYGG